jgi:ribosomal protein S24E
LPARGWVANTEYREIVTMDTPTEPSVSDDSVTVSCEFVIEASVFRGAKISEIDNGVRRGIAAKLDVKCKYVVVHTINYHYDQRDSRIKVNITRYDKQESIPELESLIHKELELKCKHLTEINNVNCIDMNSIQ